MITFRFHRGSLEDSMKTLVSFADKYEFLRWLFFHIKYFDNHGAKSPKRIEFKFYSKEDDRIGWGPVFIVLADDLPIGFATGDIPALIVDYQNE